MGDRKRSVEELEAALAEAMELNAALTRGEIDTVALEHGEPLLLRQAQQALVASERAFRAVFEGGLMPLLVTDDEGRLVDANRAAVTLLGADREDILGRPWGDFLEQGPGGDPLEPARDPDGVSRLRRPDGSVREVEVSITREVTPGRHLVALRDHTGERAAERARQRAEEDLRAREARFRAMVENGAEGIWLCDREGVVTYASPATNKLLGREPSAVVGSPISDAVFSEDRAALAEGIRRAREQPSSVSTFTLRFPDSDGAPRWLECIGSNMLDEPALGALVLNMRDVTERRNGEAQLHESRQLLETAEALAQLGGWTSQAPDAPLSWSRECARIYGRRYDDPPTIDEWMQMIHPEDRAEVMRAAERAAKADEPYEGEFRMVHPSGNIVWIHARTLINATLRWEGDRMVVARYASASGATLLGVVQDVTARRKSEEKLRESERQYRTIVEHTSDGVWVTDANGVTVFANRRFAEMLGYTVEDLIGKSGALAIFEEDLPHLSGRHEQRKRGLGARGDLRLRRKDGSELWTWLHADPIMDANGQLERVLALVIDATERRAAEAGRNHLAAIVESSDDAIIGLTKDRTIQSWNRGAEMLFGYSPAEAIGASAEMLLPPELAETEGNVLARALGGEAIRHYETVRRTKSGGRVSVSLSVSPIVDPYGRVMGAAKIVRDVTARFRAEEDRNRLVAIVESSDDAIISCDASGLIRSWNRGAERLTGYAEAEARGKPVSMLFPREHFEDVNVHIAGAGVSAQQRELTALRKDGATVDVSIRSSPLRDRIGGPLGVSLIIRDISERRRYEEDLRRTEDQLRQAQKMEAIGSLAGGVAHDFNNLLSVILGYTALMTGGLPVTDPMRDDLDEIHRAGLRASALTQQLLAFSRKQILQPVVLDVNDVLRGVHKMLSRVLGEDVELVITTSPSGGRVYADAGQIEQVIMNLVVNARDAMPGGGALTIETSNELLDAEYVAEHPGVTPGPYVLLAVTDTGVGMSREIQQRIFEPFYTTKQTGRGTGLGLSTVYGIVKQSGGHIWVYSEVGRGTTFKIYLPRTDRSAYSLEPAVLEPTSLRGHETILLVEDEAQVRGIVRTILKKNGYHVLEAQNGGEAFLICEEFGARIHLLLTDVVMPRMSGRQLAERLLRLRPDLKVLFVSGYTENTIVHHGVLDAGVDFLPKPIMPAALLKKVRSILDR